MLGFPFSYDVTTHLTDPTNRRIVGDPFMTLNVGQLSSCNIELLRYSLAQMGPNGLFYDELNDPICDTLI